MQSTDQDKNAAPDPIDNKDEISRNPDPHIDQDFPGFPAQPASEKKVNPNTTDEKKTAALDTKDGEKKLDIDRKDPSKDELESDGSGGAFSQTEL